MANKEGMNLTSFIISILCIMFLYDLTFNDYNNTMVHKFLVNQGISQKIEQFEGKSRY